VSSVPCVNKIGVLGVQTGVSGDCIYSSKMFPDIATVLQVTTIKYVCVPITPPMRDVYVNAASNATVAPFSSY
jgi:hypothetical protein